MSTYRIVRFFRENKSAHLNGQTIRRGLTLDEARAHCSDPETSSRTATGAEARKLTRRHGDWFDGYDYEGTTP